MNTEFTVDVEYEKEIDKAFFNAIFVYNYDTVGSESYSYNKIK